jgi:cobalt/nickel transport system permease protein
VSVVIALQLGAFSVVMETLLSGNSELPFGSFFFLMQPIHLAIGTVEGLVTAGIISFVCKARPEILESVPASRPLGSEISLKKIVIALAVLAVLTGGALSWFASTHPDGLEWAIAKVTGKGELVAQGHGIALFLKSIQEKMAFLPDYNFRATSPEEKKKGEPVSWPGIEAGTSVAGLLGAAIVLAIITLIGFGIRFFRGRRS